MAAESDPHPRHAAEQDPVPLFAHPDRKIGVLARREKRDPQLWPDRLFGVGCQDGPLLDKLW